MALLGHMPENLAHRSIFNDLPGRATNAVCAFAADSTRCLFYTSMLSYVFFARGSPFRAFRYRSNGLAGNISDKEDILNRIVGFLSQSNNIHDGTCYARLLTRRCLVHCIEPTLG